MDSTVLQEQQEHAPAPPQRTLAAATEPTAGPSARKAGRPQMDEQPIIDVITRPFVGEGVEEPNDDQRRMCNAEFQRLWSSKSRAKIRPRLF